MATKPLKNFPDPESIRGMARGLGVTVTDIVMASARSLELPVYTGNDPNALSIGGAGALDDSAKEALATVAREFIRLTSQREDGDPHGTGTEEEQEPRTQARGSEHSGEARGDRRRTGASMNPETEATADTGKVTPFTRRNQGDSLPGDDQPAPDLTKKRAARRRKDNGRSS